LKHNLLSDGLNRAVFTLECKVSAVQSLHSGALESNINWTSIMYTASV